MPKVTTSNDLRNWIIRLGDADIQAGIDYGIKSWIWTYDRMGSQKRRDYGGTIFNIVTGRATQHALHRRLVSLGITIDVDETDFKETDAWDFKTARDEQALRDNGLIVTTFNVKPRTPLSRKCYNME